MVDPLGGDSYIFDLPRADSFFDSSLFCIMTWLGDALVVREIYFSSGLEIADRDDNLDLPLLLRMESKVLDHRRPCVNVDCVNRCVTFTSSSYRTPLSFAYSP